MADESSNIIIEIILAGLDLVTSALASVGKDGNAALDSISEGAKSATDSLSSVANSIDAVSKDMKLGTVAAAEYQDALQKRVDAGTSMSPAILSPAEYKELTAPLKEEKFPQHQEPSPAAERQQVQPKAGSDLTILGQALSVAAKEFFKDVATPEEMDAISDRISGAFSRPLDELPEKGRKAGEDLKNTGEIGVRAFESAASATRAFVQSLDGLNASAAISGMEALAGGLASITSGFSVAGVSVSRFILGFAAIAAAIGATDIALAIFTHTTATNAVELNNLAKASGMSVVDVKALEETLKAAGAEGSSFARIIQNLGVRIQTEWPAIQRSVRDAADNIISDSLKVAEALRAMQDAQAAKEIAPVKVDQAKLALLDAERGILEAELERKNAILAINDAIINQTRAVEGLKAAHHGIVDAQLESKNAAIGLKEAIINQEQATFAVRDAQRAVLQAQQEQINAATGLADAQLAYAEAQYKYDRSQGGRRDKGLEEDFKERRDQLALEHVRSNLVAAQQRAVDAPGNTQKAILAQQQAQLAQPKADNALRAAQERMGKAADGIDRAATNLLTASAQIEKTAIATKQAELRAQAADEGPAKAAIALEIAEDNLNSARLDVISTTNKATAAEIAYRAALNAQEERQYTDIEKIAESLFTPEAEKARRGRNEGESFVDLGQVSPEKLIQALIFHASKDGKQPLTLEAFKSYSESLGASPAIMNAISRAVGGRGTSLTDAAAAKDLGDEGITKGMADPKNRELGEYLLANMQKYIAILAQGEKTKSAGEAAGAKLGTEAIPLIMPQLEILEGWLKTLPEDIDKFSKSLKGLHGTFAELKGWLDWSGIIKPATTSTKPAVKGGSDAGVVGTNVQSKTESEFSIGALAAWGAGVVIAFKIGMDLLKSGIGLALSTVTSVIKTAFSAGVGLISAAIPEAVKAAAPAVVKAAVPAAVPAAETLLTGASVVAFFRMLSPMLAAESLATGAHPFDVEATKAADAAEKTQIEADQATFRDFVSSIKEFFQPPASMSINEGVEKFRSLSQQPTAPVDGAIGTQELVRPNAEPALTPATTPEPTDKIVHDLISSILVGIKPVLQPIAPAPVQSESGDKFKPPSQEPAPEKLEVPAQKLSDAATRSEAAAQKSAEVANKEATSSQKFSDAVFKSESVAQKNETSSQKIMESANVTVNSSQATANSTSTFERVIEALASAVKSLAETLSGLKSEPAAEGHAAGGLVSGPGSSTSDSVGPVMLSDKEYVVQASAVKHWGVKALDTINAGAQGKSTGGIIGDSVNSITSVFQRLKDGGIVNEGNTNTHSGSSSAFGGRISNANHTDGSVSSDHSSSSSVENSSSDDHSSSSVENSSIDSNDVNDSHHAESNYFTGGPVSTFWKVIKQFATGGHVTGPGSSTDDSIPAMLSDGEYVVQASAVQHWGVKALDTINAGANGKAGGGIIGDSINSITSVYQHLKNGGSVHKENTNVGYAVNSMNSILHHFSEGGFVSSNQSYDIGGIVTNSLVRAPQLLDHGGMVQSSTERHTLDLRTDVGTFPASVHKDTMESLQRSAIRSKLTRTGISPGWYK